MLDQDDGNDPAFACGLIALYIGLAVMVVSGCCYRQPKTYHSETEFCPMGCSSEIPHVVYRKGAPQ